MLNSWNSPLNTYRSSAFISLGTTTTEFDLSSSYSSSSSSLLSPLSVTTTTVADIATIATTTSVAAVAAGTTMFVDLMLDALTNGTTIAVDSYAIANVNGSSSSSSGASSSSSSSGSSSASSSSNTGDSNVSSSSSSSSSSSVVLISLKESRFSLTEVIFLVIIASMLSIITVVGNVMVMVSFKIDKQLQTVSNYFLFSLAVADFAIGLISMPLFTVFTILGYWPLGPVVCDTWLALDYLASNASVLNLLIISFDRYFSVTRPLTYRAKRSPTKAGIMILGAWGISLLLWPPWIYSWPYIEGKRTVPDNDCYIQFIQTNQYITFGTAIAAFYVPVTVMCFLYWRIWRETEKRQKDLPNLQGGKQDNSKRSTSSEEQTIVDSDGWARIRSSSNVAERDVESSYLSRSYESQYPREPKARPFTCAWIRQWCIAWWHSGREDYELDDYWEDTASEAGFATPGSADTTLPSTVSRSTSLNPFSGVSQSRTMQQDTRGMSNVNKLITSRSASNDSIYTILIRLPSADCEGAGGEGPSIKMIPEMYSKTTSTVAGSLPVSTGGAFVTSTAITGTTTTTTVGGAVQTFGGPGPAPLSRRVSTMAGIESRTNVNYGGIGRAQSSRVQPSTISGGTAVKSLLPRQLPAVVGVKKKKKAQEKRADTKAAKMLSAILLAFLITWTPYNILVLLKPLTAFPEYIPKGLWDFFYYLCYINSTINPVVYALCNTTFRRTYVRILTCKWKSRHRMPINRAIYN